MDMCFSLTVPRLHSPPLSALRSCLFLSGAYSAIVSLSAMYSPSCVLPFVFRGAEYPVRGDTVQGRGRYWGVGENKHIHTCLPKTFWNCNSSLINVHSTMRNIEDGVTIGEGMHSNGSDVTRRERTLYIIYYLIT